MSDEIVTIESLARKEWDEDRQAMYPLWYMRPWVQAEAWEKKPYLLTAQIVINDLRDRLSEIVDG